MPNKDPQKRKEYNKIYRENHFLELKLYDTNRQEKLVRQEPPEKKICKLCGRTLPIDRFTKDCTRSSGYKSVCKTCQRPRNRTSENKPSVKERKYFSGIWKRFKCSREHYEFLLNRQKGLCGICGKPQHSAKSEVKRLCIDHSHKTGEIRELLCVLCNRLVGFLEDDPQIVDKAKAYVEKWNKKVN